MKSVIYGLLLTFSVAFLSNPTGGGEPTGTITIAGSTSMVGILSEQTQMLALNAEIEAAHAGKGGEGFAVIAESIGRLATRTREDAHRIEGLLEETRRRTGAIQAAADAEREEAERGQTIARELETAVEQKSLRG